jgi:hypothetical protein
MGKASSCNVLSAAYARIPFTTFASTTPVSF